MKAKKGILPSLDVLISLPFATLVMAEILFAFLFLSDRVDSAVVSESNVAEMYAMSQQIVYAIESAGLNNSQAIALMANESTHNISFSIGPLGNCSGIICRVVTIKGNSYSMVVK